MTQEQQPRFVYQPESLGGIIESTYARKRLKNRTGHAIAMDESGTLKWAARGRILDVNGAARALAATDPDLLFEVTENVCNTQSPDLPYTEIFD